MGISAVSVLIGIALFGLALGNTLKGTIAMNQHMFFIPSVICMGLGSLNIFLVTLINSSLLQQEKSS